jgi:hypothetical protein
MAKKYVTVTLHLDVGMRVRFDDCSSRGRAGVIMDHKYQATAVDHMLVAFDDQSLVAVLKSKLRTGVECHYKSPFYHYLAHKFENA